MISEKVKELENENALLRAQVERLQDMCVGKLEVPKNCEYCQNFIQHYFKSGANYYPTHDGHCAAGNRIRRKKVEETCKSFAKKEFGKNYI